MDHNIIFMESGFLGVLFHWNFWSYFLDVKFFSDEITDKCLKTVSTLAFDDVDACKAQYYYVYLFCLCNQLFIDLSSM